MTKVEQQIEKLEGGSLSSTGNSTQNQINSNQQAQNTNLEDKRQRYQHN